MKKLAILLTLVPLALSGVAHAQTAPDDVSQDVFIEEAARASLLEAALADLALRRSRSVAVQRFAAVVFDDHLKAYEKLEDIAQAVDAFLPNALNFREQRLVNQMARLSEEAFDRTYLAIWLFLQEEDIKLYERALDGDLDGVVEEFVLDVLPILGRHLQIANRVNSGLSAF